jgi:hypothetical protein
LQPDIGVRRHQVFEMSVNPRAQRRITKALLRPGDLPGIVRHYRTELQADGARELRFFAIQRSFEDAVSKAALAQRPNGKRFNHQRRIPKAALEEARRRLLGALRRLAKARSFDALFKIVEEEIGSIHKIGKLMIYDTALRIAAWRGLEPDVIYLHAGTREGARALGLDHRAATIALDAIPRSLRRLSPREIEDVLCIYKDVFRRRRSVPSTVRCS